MSSESPPQPAQSPSLRSPSPRSPASIVSLLALTAALVLVLHALGLPAAFLLGAMLAAMLVVGRGGRVRLPEPAFRLAQSTIGCLLARGVTGELLHAGFEHVLLFVVVMTSVLVVSTGLGLLLARLGLLSGSTALWGTFPGAATVMVLLSGSFGGDMRLVAVMQYLRVVVVALSASLVARACGVQDAAARELTWFVPVDWLGLLPIALIILTVGLLGPRLRVPAAPLVVPFVVCASLQAAGVIQVELPPLLLMASYVVLGWGIGLRFTPDTFRDTWRALPQVLGAVLSLVLVCAGIGWVLARLTDLDALTAYLATSPGGADTVAIIAAGTSADAPLVTAMQMGRFVTVLLLGPVLAKRVVRFAGRRG